MNLIFDNAQQNLLHEIQQHLASMCTDNTRKFIFSALTKKTIRNGIYIYGDVGRGKTTLVEHAFNQLDLTKNRYHFDTFFAKLHGTLQTKSIDQVAHEIRQKYRVIWIDELQIYDIATAMLLRRLIPKLIKQYVIILMTGNVAPEDFYKNGLNREQFIDFIPYFCDHFHCLPLNGDVDYRLRPNHRHDNDDIKKQPHFWRASLQTTKSMKSLFQSMSSSPPTPFTLELNHRQWQLAQTCGSAAFFNFSEIAEDERAFDDYRKLIKTFPTIFLTNVPIFDRTNKDACRRFMALIDIAYDCSAALFISAFATPHELYQDPDHTLPFERTASRLGEIL